MKISGRQDLNLRPSAPKADALPNCATPRFKINILNLIIIISQYLKRICSLFCLKRVCEN